MTFRAVIAAMTFRAVTAAMMFTRRCFWVGDAEYVWGGRYCAVAGAHSRAVCGRGGSRDDDRGESGAGARPRILQFTGMPESTGFDRRTVVYRRRNCGARAPAHGCRRRARCERVPRGGHCEREPRSDVCRSGTDAAELGRVFTHGYRIRRGSRLDVRIDDRRWGRCTRNGRSASRARFSTTREAELYNIAIATLEAAGWSSTKSATSPNPDIAAGTMPITGRTVNTWALGWARRRIWTACASFTPAIWRRTLRRYSMSGDSAGVGAAPGRAARGRGRDAGAANVARGIAAGLQRALRLGLFANLRSHRAALPGRRAAGDRRHACAAHAAGRFVANDVCAAFVTFA